MTRLIRITCPARLARFLRDQRGAVTVDWVVLAAGVIGLCLLVTGAVGGGTASASDKMGDRLATVQSEVDW